MEKFVHECLLKFKTNFNNDEGKDKKEVRDMIKALQECLNFEPKERPDFLELFCKKMADNKNKQKMKFHLLIENLEYEEVMKLLEKKAGVEQK